MREVLTFSPSERFLIEAHGLQALPLIELAYFSTAWVAPRSTGLI